MTETDQATQQRTINTVRCSVGADETGNIEMQCCDAYEAVKQSESEMDYSYIYATIK